MEKAKGGIKDWAADDKPREKLLIKGKNALSNSELLAIIISSGSINESAVDLSKRILESCDNNLVSLSKLNIAQLKKFKGIGTVKALTIEAALELGRRRQASAAVERPQIINSNDAYQYLKTMMEDIQHEEAWVLFLDRNSKPIAIENVSKGGLSSTVIDTKTVYKRAIEIGASMIIMAHNHPSGNCKPSKADDHITKQFVETGKLIDIQLADHLIITSTAYYSYADQNQIIN